MTELLYILVLGIIAYICFSIGKSPTKQVIKEIKKDPKLSQELFDVVND